MGRVASPRWMARVLLAVLLQSSVVACSTTAMLRPPAVPAPLPATRNHQIILDVLSQRRWAVESDTPGEIVARYDKKQHMARVRITYDDSDIRIAYADSRELDCKPAGDACSSINKAYNRWVNNLYQDLRARVEGAS